MQKTFDFKFSLTWTSFRPIEIIDSTPCNTDPKAQVKSSEHDFSLISSLDPILPPSYGEHQTDFPISSPLFGKSTIRSNNTKLSASLDSDTDSDIEILSSQYIEEALEKKDETTIRSEVSLIGDIVSSSPKKMDSRLHNLESNTISVNSSVDFTYKLPMPFIDKSKVAYPKPLHTLEKKSDEPTPGSKVKNSLFLGSDSSVESVDLNLRSNNTPSSHAENIGEESTISNDKDLRFIKKTSVHSAKNKEGQSVPQKRLRSLSLSSFSSIDFVDSSFDLKHISNSKVENFDIDPKTSSNSNVSSKDIFFDPLSSPLFSDDNNFSKKTPYKRPSLKRVHSASFSLLGENIQPHKSIEASGKILSLSKVRRTQTEKTALQFEKEKRKEQKELERREKKIEKNRLLLLNSVNKQKLLQTEEAIKDITLHMSKQFSEETELGKQVKLGLVEKDISIKYYYDHFSEEGHGIALVNLQRNVTCQYDESQDIFIPVSQHMENLKTIFVLIDSEKYRKSVFYEETDEIVSHILKTVTKKVPTSYFSIQEDMEVICIWQGLGELIRKSTNSKNQNMINRVRALMGDQPTSGKKTKKRSSSLNSLHPLILEEACYELEFKHSWRIIHSSDESSTVEWFKALLANESVAWFKKRKVEGFMAAGIANGGVGYVKSGVDPAECMERSLQHMKYVTPKLAKTISKKFGSLQSLALNTNKFEDVMGKSLSRSLRSLLTEKDPDAFI